jgi:hypothetical protein
VRSILGWLGGSAPVNPLSLGALFAILVAMHEMLLMGALPVAPKELVYLQLVSVSQCAFITAFVALTATLLPRLTHAIVGLALTIPVLLYVDALVRIRVGRHLPSVAGLLLGVSVDENRKLLQATGVDARAVAALVLGLAVVAVGGAWVDRRVQPLAARLARIRRSSVVAVCLATGAALGALEVGAAGAVRAVTWSAFDRSVPLLLTGLAPSPKAKTAVRVHLRPRPSEGQVAGALARLEMPSTPPLGDLFVFVVDSLRSAAIEASSTPALAALSRDAMTFETAVSGGNITHYGRYSLFWSNPAFYWRLDPGADERGGAVPLRVAKRRGWRIEMLTSDNAGYMNLDTTLLGVDRHLADAFDDFHGTPGTSADHDAQIVRELIHRIGVSHRPTAYLVFLDAAHLPYLWTDDFVPPFTPYADAGHYMRMQRSTAERRAVENRYRDAVAFVDSLMGHFVGALRAGGGYEESTIAVVGDHGEEFWEHDHTSHGSEACSAQTHVALLLKLPRSSLGDGDTSAQKRVASTMDVWPTILDAAGVRGLSSSLFFGRSFRDVSPRAAIAANQRYWYPPSRFVLDDGDKKVVFELSQPDEPLREQDLQVIEILDENDVPIHTGLTPREYETLVHTWFGADLERFFIVRW